MLYDHVTLIDRCRLRAGHAFITTGGKGFIDDAFTYGVLTTVLSSWDTKIQVDSETAILSSRVPIVWLSGYLWPRSKKMIESTAFLFCVSRESNAGPIDGNDGFYH